MKHLILLKIRRKCFTSIEMEKFNGLSFIFDRLMNN